MQINATQIREGMILIINNDLYKVTWTMHRTPGKGNACMQTKMKQIPTGKNLEKRFLSTERVEKAHLETINMQFLYKETNNFIFMDNETFDQVSITENIIEKKEAFIKEGENYPILCYNNNPLDIELPLTMIFEVTEAAPNIKKATSTASLKPITLNNNLIIQAPGFIKVGDKIKINTNTQEYVERAN